MNSIHHYENVPVEMRDLPQWVAHRAKVPFNVHTDTPASSTDPATWATFREALSAINRFDGIGFALQANDGLVVIDLDTVRDPETGEVDPIALEVIHAVNSYCEISPSGFGFHIFAYSSTVLTWNRNPLPDNGIHRPDIDLKTGMPKTGKDGFPRFKKPEIEIYCQARCMTMTGNIFESYNQLRESTAAIDAIVKKYDNATKNCESIVCQQTIIRPKSDKDYLSIGLEKDPVLRSLWNGERSSTNESSNDLALMNKLAFWLNADPNAMISSFLNSPFCHQKDAKHLKKVQRVDYLPRTAKKAIEGLGRTAFDVDQSFHAKFNQSVPTNALADSPQAPEPKHSAHNLFAPLADFDEVEASWLVEGLIPAGQITLLAADGGAGKTTVTCALAAAISSGCNCFLDPPNAVREPQKVMLLNAEDSVSEKLRKRIRLFGGNLNNIIAPNVVDDQADALSELKIGASFFKDVICYYSPALCIIDPLQSFVPSKINMSSRSEMRQCLQTLTKLGQETGCSFIVVCHSNKRKGASGRDRISESSDIWDISRSVLMIGHTADDDIRYLSNEKNNYFELHDTILFQIAAESIAAVGTSTLRDADYVALTAHRSPRHDDNEPLNEDLVQALTKYLGSSQDAKIPYTQVENDYGTEIWKKKSPKVAISHIQNVLELSGIHAEANYSIKINGKTCKGVKLSTLLNDGQA